MKKLSSIFQKYLSLKKRYKISLFILLSPLIIFIGYKAILAATSTFFITNSSTTTATQASTMKHLVRTSDGTLHALVQVGTQTATCNGSSKSGLAWFYSLDSGSTWTCGEQLSSDTTNLFYASATTDTADNVYMVYSVATGGVNSSYDVYYQKLSKNQDRSWTVGASQKMLDANASQGYSFSVIEVEGTSRAWVSTRYFDGANYQVSVYYSDDLSSAPNWNLSQIALDTPVSNANYHIPAMVRFGSKIGVLYTAQLPAGWIMWRVRDDADSPTSWQPENVVSTTTPGASSFSAISDLNGNVYMAQNAANNINFNYWNGSVWSQTATLTTTATNTAFVSLSTDGSSVWVFYGDPTNLAGGQRKLVYKKGIYPFSSTDFDANPTPVVDYHSTFDKYWSYFSGAYTDDTADAANITSADTQMVKNIGDIIYFGKSSKFDSISWSLSTNGAGGAVVWEYWNGSSWSTLTFTASAFTNLAGSGWGSFTDPADWASTKVNNDGVNYYYVRARVTSNLSTAPVGVQMVTIPTIYWSNFLPSPTAGVIYGMWTENASSPIRVKTGSVTVTTTTPNTSTTSSISPGTVAYSGTVNALYPSTMKHLVRTSDGTLHAFVQAHTVSACGREYEQCK